MRTRRVWKLSWENMKQKAVDGTHTAGKWLYAHKTIVESGCGAM